jgi:hypothetical protein
VSATRRRNFKAAAAGLALTAAGAVLLYTGRVRKAPDYWERVEGRVVSSEVKEANGRRYAEIRFEYEAFGRKVLGRQLQFGPGPVRDIAAAHPPGKPIAVRYDPAQPEHAMVSAEPGPSWRWGIAAVLMGGGVALLLWGMRRRQ